MRAFVFTIALLYSTSSIAQYWKLDSIQYNNEYYWLYPKNKAVNVYEDNTIWMCEKNLFCPGLPKDGKWIQFFAEDTTQPAYIWGYKDNNKNGEWTSFFLNGKIKEKGSYVKGQKGGHWISYFENGNVECDAYYTNGNLSGHWKCWDEKGWLYKYGIEDSLLVEFFATGQKKTEYIYFKNGQINSEWYENGQLASRQTYLLGYLKDTIQTSYYPNGQIKAKGRTKNGSPFGIWKTFYENGQLQAEGYYSQYQSLSTDYVPRVQFLSYKTGAWAYYYESGQVMAKGSYQKRPTISRPGYLTVHKATSIKNKDWKYFDKHNNPTRMSEIASGMLFEE